MGTAGQAGEVVRGARKLGREGAELKLTGDRAGIGTTMCGGSVEKDDCVRRNAPLELVDTGLFAGVGEGVR
jgi:hypothetical protein